MPIKFTVLVRTKSTAKKRQCGLQASLLAAPGSQPKRTLKELRAEKAQRYQDEVDRIPIEDKFGNVKGKGSLGRIMTKLRQTSESVIHVGIVVLNLQTWLRKGSLCLYFAVLELLQSLFDQLNQLKKCLY